MKKAYLFCDKRSINDATFHYIDILNKSLMILGYQLDTVHKLSEIVAPDLILTITGKYFFMSYLMHPFTDTIYWSQGVGPEEELMAIGKKRARYYFRRVLEFLAIKRAKYLLLVSESMRKHYLSKYNYRKNNYCIMPCYNMPLCDYCNEEKYRTPSFVYAGGAGSWQCIEPMLDTYKYIEERLPDSKLVILTLDRVYFEKEIKKRNISRYSIDYVSKDNLNKELSKYKYAFLLRENHIVNNVATPTKMNSYLANYLIPIYTNAVHSFEENISLGKYALCFETPINPQYIAQRIVAFERENRVDVEAYKTIVKDLFLKYYNDESYIAAIVRLLEK